MLVRIVSLAGCISLGLLRRLFILPMAELITVRSLAHRNVRTSGPMSLRVRTT